MSVDPYAPPQAPVADRSAVRVPPAITAKIRGAVIAALITGGIVAVLVVLSLVGQPLLGVDAWSAVDAVFYFGLAFGVHRKSRVCAVLLLLLFAAGRITIMIENGRVDGVIVTALFIYYYARGVMGTFEYHRFMRDPAASAAYGRALDATTSERVAALEALRAPPPPAAESAPDSRA